MFVPAFASVARETIDIIDTECYKFVMSTEMFPQPNRRDRYKLYMPDVMMDVLHAMSTERVALYQQYGEQPAKSDLSFLNTDDPTFKLSDLEDILALAKRVEEFANNTERAVTHIAIDCPPEIAEQFIVDRENLATNARELSKTLFKEYEVYQAMGQSSESDPDEWLRNLS